MSIGLVVFWVAIGWCGTCCSGDQTQPVGVTRHKPVKSSSLQSPQFADVTEEILPHTCVWQPCEMKDLTVSWCP